MVLNDDTNWLNTGAHRLSWVKYMFETYVSVNYRVPVSE